MKVCGNNNMEIVELFLDKEADVNSFNNNRDFF